MQQGILKPYVASIGWFRGLITFSLFFMTLATHWNVLPSLKLPAVLFLPSSGGSTVAIEPIKEVDLSSEKATILIVDDEEEALKVGEELLRKLGYRVLLARSGKEAIEIYKRNRDKVNLSIVSLLIPSMECGELFCQLKEINPEIKVLFSSNFGIEIKGGNLPGGGYADFVKKPFKFDDLSNKLRTVLDHNRFVKK